MTDSRRMVPGDWLTVFFLLGYPALAMLLQGGASALTISAAVLSIAVLVLRSADAPYGYVRPDGLGLAVCIALAAPVAAVALSTLSHGHPVFRTWDSPSRFLLAIPIFLALRRAPQRVLAWADLAFTFGALAALVIALAMPRDWGDGRVGSKFLNPIYFGDLSLVLGVLSATAMNWWRKDRMWVRVFKIVGLFAGLTASLISGARGGWIAIPIVAVLILWERGRSKSLRWNVLMPLVIALLLALVYGTSSTVRERIDMVSGDLTQYTHGNRDTSIGIRLQLYTVAWKMIGEHPVLGLGADGFADEMDSLARRGVITLIAAENGEGQTHNQLLAYLVNYGIVGGVALLAIYFVPASLFVRRLKAAPTVVRRTALMGLLLVTMFFVFGLTVETFVQKSTVSFYVTMLAVLAAIVDRTDIPSAPS